MNKARTFPRGEKFFIAFLSTTPLLIAALLAATPDDGFTEYPALPLVSGSAARHAAADFLQSLPLVGFLVGIVMMMLSGVFLLRMKFGALGLGAGVVLAAMGAVTGGLYALGVAHSMAWHESCCYRDTDVFIPATLTPPQPSVANGAGV